MRKWLETPHTPNLQTYAKSVLWDLHDCIMSKHGVHYAGCRPCASPWEQGTHVGILSGLQFTWPRVSNENQQLTFEASDDSWTRALNELKDWGLPPAHWEVEIKRDALLQKFLMGGTAGRLFSCRSTRQQQKDKNQRYLTTTSRDPPIPCSSFELSSEGSLRTRCSRPFLQHTERLSCRSTSSHCLPASLIQYKTLHGRSSVLPI